MNVFMTSLIELVHSIIIKCVCVCLQFIIALSLDIRGCFRFDKQDGEHDDNPFPIATKSGLLKEKRR